MRIRKIENERKRENDKEWCDDNKQKGREGGREEEEEEEGGGWDAFKTRTHTSESGGNEPRMHLSMERKMYGFP